MPLIDSGDINGILYYVMPFIEGESLRARLGSGEALSIDESLTIAKEVAAALEYAHGRGVVHRDVKPENILLSSGIALVVDFGIARAIWRSDEEGLTETGLAIGTPAYLSPEQAAGEPHVDGRSDIYSLSCVVYEMLSGSPPFAGRSGRAIIASHILDSPPNLERLRPDIPLGVARAVKRALAKDPEHRFARPCDFIASMHDSNAHITSSRNRRKGAGGWAGRHPVTVALLVALFLTFAWTAARSAADVEQSGLIVSLPQYLSAWIALMFGVWFLFEKAEESVTPQVRQTVSRWLMKLDVAAAVRTWPSSFLRIFDSVFGRRHLSLRCFLRSSLVSLASVTILTMIWLSLLGVSLNEIIGPTVLWRSSYWARGAIVMPLFVALPFMLCFNLLVDYVSLLETRYVLGILADVRSRSRTAALLTVDILATGVVWIVFWLVAVVPAIGLGLIIGDNYQGDLYHGALLAFWTGWDVVAGDLDGVIRGNFTNGATFFYSTFVTSFWLWLYVGTSLLVRASGPVGKVVSVAKHGLDLEERPIAALGLVAILLVTIAFACGLLVILW